MIEEGRYRDIDRINRICTYCNMNAIENEYHFLLVCPFYRDLRSECLPKYYCSWPSIQKFKYIMKCDIKSTIIKLSKYLFLANKRRTSV